MESSPTPNTIAEPVGGPPHIFRALRHRNYRLFFFGQIISLVGTVLTQSATGWLVRRLTNSATMLGVVAFASLIPAFFLGPIAGVWVDRINRQRLIICTQILAMLQSLALAVLAWSGRINITEIIVLACFQGLINAFDMPARQAFLIEMVVDREDLSNAIALNSTMVHTARLIGPAAAGLLIGWLGEASCFTIDGVSYIAVILALIAMRVVPRPPRLLQTSVLTDLKEGAVYVWSNVAIRTLLLFMALIALTAMPALSVLMPIFGKYFGGDEVHGARYFGFLGAAAGGGALIGALFLANRRTVLGLGRLIAIASSVAALALIAFGWSHTLWLSLLIVPLAGWGMMTTFASANTVLQTMADDDKRGRLMSFFAMAFMGMTPWGSLLAGYLATRLGPGGHAGANTIIGAGRTLRVEGLVCLFGTMAFAALLPRIRANVRPIYIRKGIIVEDITEGLAAEAMLSEAAPE